MTTLGATPSTTTIGTAASSAATDFAMDGVINVAGHYFAAPTVGSTTGTPSLDYVYLMPIVVADSLTLTRICIEVTTGVATATPRLGIFTRNVGSGGVTCLLDAGTVDGSSTGLKEITISQALTTGLYWLAFCNQVAAAAVRCSLGIAGTRGSTAANASGGTAVGASYFGPMASGPFTSGSFAGITSLAPRVYVRV